jgi:hypothetical protein
MTTITAKSRTQSAAGRKSSKQLGRKTGRGLGYFGDDND